MSDTVRPDDPGVSPEGFRVDNRGRRRHTRITGDSFLERLTEGVLLRLSARVGVVIAVSLGSWLLLEVYGFAIDRMDKNTEVLEQTNEILAQVSEQQALLHYDVERNGQEIKVLKASHRPIWERLGIYGDRLVRLEIIETLSGRDVD